MQRLCYLFIITGLYFLCLPQAVAIAGEKINVFVSILPQKFLVERVGGNRVNVSVMVKPGLSPETYEPTARQMAALDTASLYFRIAVPFESVWIERIKALNPNLRIIDCCGDLMITDPGNRHDENYNSGYANDAHVWTSPTNAMVLAGIIKSALSEHDPGSAEYYLDNYHILVNDLEVLDAFIRKELAGIENPYFIVSHPSWGHYAGTYGLEQISIEQHGTEVRARELSRLVELARKQNIHIIYVQKQFNTAAAQALAREINGRIIELDPLAEDYINNLRYVTRMFVAGAMRQ